MTIRPYAQADLPGILRLCEIEHWPSLLEDHARAHRVLTAPGVTTVVADEAGEVAGFAQMLSDGEIQAHLSMVAVDPAHRRKGLATDLIRAALAAAGGERVDLLTDGAEDFYAALPHFRMSGFRLYPTYTGPDRERPGVTWKDGRRE
jgi:ribosomal protein S18 acetylase RimI-like enzyme